MFCNLNYQSLASIASHFVCVTKRRKREFSGICLTAVKHDAIIEWRVKAIMVESKVM